MVDATYSEGILCLILSAIRDLVIEWAKPQGAVSIGSVGLIVYEGAKDLCKRLRWTVFHLVTISDKEYIKSYASIISRLQLKEEDRLCLGLKGGEMLEVTIKRAEVPKD